MSAKYKGWQIDTHRQRGGPQWLDFYAWATKPAGNGGIVAFNVDGASHKDAMELAKCRIDRREP